MFVGADVDRLDELARVCSAGLRTSEEIAAALTGLADRGVPVFGPYGQQLAGELTDLARQLSDGGRDLDMLATGARDNAAQQRSASRGLAALDRLRAAGVPPSRYRGQLRQYWLDRASERSGIDMSRWDPNRGVAGLRDTISRVYTYYGSLYLAHPYLQWAGMANMMGPTFAAGFFDLSLMRQVAQGLEGVPGLPVPVSPIAHISDRELRFFETTFLQMQRDIFVDQAVMHEAYLGGGLTAIRELRLAGIIDARTEQAWQQIDEGRRTGNADLLAAGNTTLLYREQHDIIQANYQRMYDRPGTGPAFTYLMTAIGEPSIPGARTFAQFQPLTVTVETPGPRNIPFTGWDNPLQGQLTVRTPLPAGNVADFDDRWTHIWRDTLPAYQRLLREDPDRVRQIVGGDIGQRIDEYRIYRRVDDIVGRLTDWGVRFRQ